MRASECDAPMHHRTMLENHIAANLASRDRRVSHEEIMQEITACPRRTSRLPLGGLLLSTLLLLAPAAARAANLISIVVSPDGSSLTEGFAQQFTAAARYSDGSSQDVTQSATWATSSSHTAIVSNVNGTRGLVTAVNAGGVTISATLTQGLSTTKGSAQLTVVAAQILSLTTKPTSKKIDIGADVAFSAKAALNNGQTRDVTDLVDWSSSDTSVATVGNTEGVDKGVVHGVASGTAIIHATDPTTSVTNSDADGTTTVLSAITAISISPSSLTTAWPLSYPLKVNALRADGSTSNITSRVKFTTNPTGIVAIDSSGNVTGIAKGTTSVSAFDPASGLGSSPAGDATVTLAGFLKLIAITPDPLTVAQGQVRSPSVIGTCFNGKQTSDLRSVMQWSVADTSIATVGNTDADRGKVTGVGPGTTTLTASEPLTSVTTTQTNNLVVRGAPTGFVMSPTSAKVALDDQVQFKARATYSDGSSSNASEQCDWSTDDATIASVTNVSPGKGLVTGIKLGTTTVRASCSGTTVTGSIQVIGHLQSINVTPNPFSAESNVQKQYHATGQYDDGSTNDLTKAVSWSSTNPTVATVNTTDDPGNVTMLAKGMTNIIADDGKGHTGSGALTVIGELQSLKIIAPTGFTTLRGSTTVPLRVQGTFSDGTKQFLTGKILWTSSNNVIATVSNSAPTVGLVTAGNTEGMVQITVTSSVNKQISTSINITVKGLLTSFVLNPTSLSVAVNRTASIAALGTFTDGATGIAITKSVVFQSSNSGVAQVSNAPGSHGLLTAVAKGQAQVTAADPSSGKGSSNMVTVTVHK